MAVLIFAVPIAGITLATPTPARAQIECPACEKEPSKLAIYIKNLLTIAWEQGAALAFKNALKVYLSQIAYDAAVWIGSGGKNQKPLVYATSTQQFWEDASSAAAGEFLNVLFTENGYFEYDLCKPLDLNAQLYLGVAIGLAIPDVDIGLQLPEAEFPFARDFCTLEDIRTNFLESSLSADFATGFALTFIPTENDFGVYSTAVATGYDVSASQEQEAVLKRLKGDFADLEGKVSGYIATPGSAVEHQYFLSLDASTQAQTTYTGQLFADTLDIFTSTLISKLLQRLQSGLISDFTTPSIADSLSGSGATAGGVRAAREKYLTLTEVPVTRGTDLDILTQLANCPPQGADIINCVIDESFRSAVEQGKTVRQALDEGLIDGSKPFAVKEGGEPILSPFEGMPFRSLVILKHYRIVPVGWQIAAEYLRDFGGGSSVTLQDLVDAYDNCGADDYSPYCKLVDPDWVLTSPEGICNLEAFGQNILTSSFIDTDGLDATPETMNLIRSQSCVDDQSCLRTDSDGNCEAYGYCVEEKRIYRFQGDECPERYSSCQTYSNELDEEVSYLSNTLNFNNCDAGTAGCEWYCTAYNEINQEWQCSENGSIYNSCTSDESSYETTSAGTCGCTADDGTTCDIQENGFKCTTSTGSECTLGTSVDSDLECTTVTGPFGLSLSTCPLLSLLGLTGSGFDSAINFDDGVSTCSEDNAGCAEFIRTTSGANLVVNSSFEYFNAYSEAPDDNPRGEEEIDDGVDDTFGFYAEDADDPGEPCNTDSSDNNCIGWELGTGTMEAVSDPFDGFVAVQLSSAGALQYNFETGYALADRTFDLTYFTQNDGSADCKMAVTLNGTNLTNPNYSGVATFNVDAAGTGEWEQHIFDAYTFPSTTTDTELSLNIAVPNSCASELKLDAFDLTETSDVESYTGYNTVETIHMKDDRLQCAVEDIGCELYTPSDGTADDAIPGEITSELSDACTGVDGLTDPSCSLCTGTTTDDEFVGCDFYQEQPLVNSAPVPSMAGFTTAPSAEQRAGIVKRTGFYCNNTGFEGESCYDDSDCGGEVGACVDSASIIPSTGETCSAQYVGCEEYTNLDTVSAGGENLEYYSYIKQCVKDTPEQRAGADGSEATTSDNEIHTYVTFEGSDVSGYSLRSFDLKKSNVDTGPCTNLDLYGTTAESSEAVCIDTAATQHSCTASDIGVDPDCTEFIDPNTGTSYYRLKSYTITASDDCHPLRNSLDGRIYYSIPSDSISCPAKQNLCREYKGSAGGDVYQVLNEDFEDGIWTQTTGSDAEQSSESSAAGGHSMSLSSDTVVQSLVDIPDTGDPFSFLEEGLTYVLSFWAKSPGNGGGISIYFDSATSVSTDAQVYFMRNDVNSVSGDTITIDEDWHQYTLGPIIMPRAGEVDDQLVIYVDDSPTVYIDNVVLEESEAQYLIKDTASLCTGYEGCEEYADRAGDTHYIKSFTRLCEEQFVGCEALISTSNSASPFTEVFLGDNDFNSSNRPSDDVVIIEDTVVAYVNDENVYCDASAEGCTEFGLPEVDDTTNLAESFTSTFLLNDPDQYADILCSTDAISCQEYTSSDDEVVYFKDPGTRTCEYKQASTGTEYSWYVVGTEDPCPLFDAAASPGQPMGAICEGGERDGLFCGSDDDCPADDADTDPHCRSDDATDADSNGYPDSGWTGTCSAAYSGCTEYQDSNTDNLVPNSGFEEDKYRYVGDPTYATDDSAEVSDSIPDYFENPSILLPVSGLPIPVYFTCDTFLQITEQAHTGQYSLKMAQNGLFADGDGIGCTVIPEGTIAVDTSKTYTLSFNVFAAQGFEGTNNETTFGAGLYYFDADGALIYPTFDYDGDGTTLADEDYGDLAAYTVAAQAETISSDEEGTWLRYTGEIGNRLDLTWPSVDNQWGHDVVTVLPYIYAYTPSGVPIHVDDFSFVENDPYFYINASVDGAPEAEENSCNGEVEIGQGCVAFRDVTSKDLSYLSAVEAEQGVNSEFTVQNCTIGATDDETTNCRATANAADSNMVLLVKPDRECEEWLTCKTSSITTDSEGNEETTCLTIGGCDELSDNGLCGNQLGHTDPDNLGTTSDLTFRSAAGGTVQLDNLLNLSGYSAVGAKWGKTNGTCDSSSNTCTDGPLLGDSCDPANGDDDCQLDEIVDGYYPYEDMPQEGEDGLTFGNTDLIQDGDFEGVVCNGNSPWEMSFNGTDYIEVDDIFASSRTQAQTCVLDDQCRSQKTEAKFAEIENANDQELVNVSLRDGASVSELSTNTDFSYSEGWCSNPDEVNQPWGLFSPSNEDSLISIIEYDPLVDFSNPIETTLRDTVIAGSSTLDLDNVLYVEASGSGQGVQYTFEDPDALINGDQYAVSFDAAWAPGESAGSNDHLTVGLEWSDGTTEHFKLCDDKRNCGQSSVELTAAMTSYALILTPASKPDDADSATVFIHANSDTAFVVDDWSMLPSLEINKELNNVARECRAYPAENALQCNYDDPNGSIYRGIHGYCLENDAFYRNKCVTWWPVDVISGDTDTRSKTAAGYDGRVNVYYCAVARGLEDLMVCDGGQRDGALCSGLGADADDYCQGSESDGECVRGYQYLDATGGFIAGGDVWEQVTSRDGDDSLGEGGYQTIPRQIAIALGQNDGNPSALARSSPANQFEQTLTVADINEMRLYISFVEANGGDVGEWPEDGTHYRLGDPGDGEIDASGNVTEDGSEPVTITDYTNDGTSSGTVKGTYCNWDAVDIDNDGNGSVKWVWQSIPSGNSFGLVHCEADPFTNYNWPSASSTATEGYTIADVLDVDGNEEAYGYTETGAGSGDTNTIAFNFVFADGVLNYVEYIINSATTDDRIYIGFYVEWQLNESCALAVQAVDENGETVAWLDRLSSTSAYALPNTNYVYSDGNTPFGSVHTQFADIPDQWEGDFELTPFDPNDDGTLVLYREDQTNGSGLPFACIGKCDNNICAQYDEMHPVEQGYGATTAACNADESFSCEDNTGLNCLGVDGNATFSSAGIEETYYDADGSFQVESYNDQLHAAMNVAREDLSMIFAELQGTTAWVREEGDDALASQPGYLQNLWEDFGVDNIFDEMDICSGARGDDDYCAIRPSVNGIEVNGQIGDVFIAEGESIRLSFGSDADDNQVPITNIRVIWEGIDGHTFDQDFDTVEHTDDQWMAAPSSEHVYANAYVCNETDPNYYEEITNGDGDDYAGVCVYEIRIQVQDYWGFCSGLQDIDDGLDDYRGDCNSYDEFTGHIVVTPN